MELNILNKICPLYHSNFGVYPCNDTNMSDFCAHGRDVQDIDELEEILLDNDCYVTLEEENSNFITDFNDIPEFANYYVYYKLTYIQELSQRQLPYDKVIIRYADNTWYGTLTEWYNRPSKWCQAISTYLKSYVLPHFNTRPYIHINEPFMKVSIYATEKGQPITYEDILFATRALCVDDSRTIESFTNNRKHQKHTYIRTRN